MEVRLETDHTSHDAWESYTPQDRAHDGSKRASFNLTRRSALRVFFGLGILTTSAALITPVSAHAASSSGVDEAQSELDDAEQQYNEVQSQLDQITSEYESLAEQQASTLSQIEDTQGQIDALQSQIDDAQGQIDEKQQDLDAKKAILAERVAAAYKSGGTDFVSVLLSSKSFEELSSNIYYLDKISESDANMIAEVRSAKEALDAQRAALEDQKSDLEDQKSQLDSLNQQQQQQLSDLQSKQDEVQSTLSNLSDQVSQLVDQRDSEVVAYNNARAAEETAAAAAAAAASSSSSSSGSSSSQLASSGSQQAVVNACYSVASPGAGYCAMWVSEVMEAAGVGYVGGNACDMYANYCTSSNRSDLQVGMIIAVSTHSLTSAGRLYGHVGIYVGGGTVMDNVGYIRSISVDTWISTYDTTVTPRWGWAGGVVLS
jgi:peptidoglycan hydrolase CwlO-like protein